jgi:CBS domain-containing protein
MHRRRFRSLPVVDRDGRVIGIVSRRDLLQAFLRPDGDIRDEIKDEILHDRLWIEDGAVGVEVAEGVVTLTGTVDRASVVPILVRMVEGVDGVVRVHHRLGFEFDDTEVRPSVPTPWGVVPSGSR